MLPIWMDLSHYYCSLVDVSKQISSTWKMFSKYYGYQPSFSFIKAKSTRNSTDTDH
jgi:hypothetical protein